MYHCKFGALLNMYEWETISSKILFKHHRVEVSEDTVRIEDGRILNDYIQITTNDHCVIIPINEHGQYLLFKQYKYGPRCTSFTFPAGNIENKEEPINAAKRELLEEAGLISEKWTALGSYTINGNQGVGRAHIFLAQNVVLDDKPLISGYEDIEEQIPIWLDQQELKEHILSEKFVIISHALAAQFCLTR